MRGAALIAAALLLGACAAPGPVPEDHFYRLAEPAAAARAQPPLLDGRLVVAPLEADGLYAERAIVYSEDAQRRELRQYHYHYWLDAPSRLIQDYLAARLAAGALAREVVTEYSPAPADYVLKGRIRRLERFVGPERVEATVGLELSLRGPGGAPALLSARYTAAAPAESQQMRATVAAFEGALDEIATALERDAAAALAHAGRQDMQPAQ